MSEKQNLAVLILAAGNSDRLGNYPKQLLKFKGKTLIRNITEAAVDAMDCENVFVVLGAQSQQILEEIMDLPVRIIANDEWEKGIGASLKAGINYLIRNEGYFSLRDNKTYYSAACVLLSDQPLVDEKFIRRLIEAFKESEKLIVATEYENSVGVPAIFSNQLFRELLELPPDEGAKNIIQKYAESTVKIAFPGASLDVDTWENYETLKKMENG